MHLIAALVAEWFKLCPFEWMVVRINRVRITCVRVNRVRINHVGIIHAKTYISEYVRTNIMGGYNM